MAVELPEGDLCAFCEIIEGRQGQGVVEETELTITLVNIRQFEEGQVLVIPRRHAPTLLDLTDSEVEALAHASRRVADALVKTYNPDGMTVYQNNGTVSRQEIPHYHMHLVPRRKSGGWGPGPRHIAEIELTADDIAHRVMVSVDETIKVAERIRAPTSTSAAEAGVSLRPM